MRKRAIRTLVEVILFDIIISAIVALMVAFPIMLSFGTFHSEFPGVPAFGYWATYVIILAGSIVMNLVRTFTKYGSGSKTS